MEKLRNSYLHNVNCKEKEDRTQPTNSQEGEMSKVREILEELVCDSKCVGMGLNDGKTDKQRITQAEHDIREAIIEKLPGEKEFYITLGRHPKNSRFNKKVEGYNQYRKDAIEAITKEEG